MPCRCLGNTRPCFGHMRTQLRDWVARPFFIPVVHRPLGGRGVRGSTETLISGEARPGPRGSARAHLDREARSGAEEHVRVPELSSQGGRV
jgi:hypothetical protein